MKNAKQGDVPAMTSLLFDELEIASRAKKVSIDAKSTPPGRSPDMRTPTRRTKSRASAPEPGASASDPVNRLPDDRSARPSLDELVSVPVDQIVLHSDLAITNAEIEGIAAKSIEAITDQLARGIAPAETPRVVVLADGRFGALTGLETVIAAQRVAAVDPAFVMTVLVSQPLDGADRLIGALYDPRKRSPWERYRELAAEFGDGQVRDKLRALDLPVERWESRVSKLLKLGRLDPLILAAVNKLTIQVKEAGQVVDGWADPEKRPAMERVLDSDGRGTNDLLDARPLFRAMFAAGRPEVALPVWQTNDDGKQVFVAADGTLLAKLIISKGGWKLEGRPLSAGQYRAMTKGLPLA